MTIIQVIKDYKLFGIVVFLLAIDIIILSCWQIFDPLILIRKKYEVFLKFYRSVVLFII